MPTTKKDKKAKRLALRFVIRCTKPVEDGILDLRAFEKFLHDRIKVDGKTGQLGSKVKVSKDKVNIIITAVPPFGKRYLKYLTKKFLKKHQLRDWLHVIADSSKSYDLRYFDVQGDEDGDDE